MGLTATGLFLIYPYGRIKKQANVVLFEGQRIMRIVWWHKRDQCWSQSTSAVPCSVERSPHPVSLCFYLSFFSSAFSIFTDKCSNVTFYDFYVFSFEIQEYFRRKPPVGFIHKRKGSVQFYQAFLGNAGSQLVAITLGLSYCLGLVLQCSGASRSFSPWLGEDPSFRSPAAASSACAIRFAISAIPCLYNAHALHAPTSLLYLYSECCESRFCCSSAAGRASLTPKEM